MYLSYQQAQIRVPIKELASLLVSLTHEATTWDDAITRYGRLHRTHSVFPHLFHTLALPPSHRDTARCIYTTQGCNI